MWAYNYNDELYHYGVKGMKWGLIREQKKASRETRESELTPEQRKKRANLKKGVIIGSSVAGAALATFGAYKLHKAINNHAWNKAVDIGSKKVKELDSMIGIGKSVIKDRDGFEIDTIGFRIRKEANRAYDAMHYADKIKYFVNDLKKK